MKEYKVGQVVRNAHGVGEVWATVTKVEGEMMTYVVIKSGLPGRPGSLMLGSTNTCRVTDTTAWEVVPPGESIVITEKPVARVGEFFQAKSGTVYMVTGFTNGNVPRARVVVVGMGSSIGIDSVVEIDPTHCTKVTPNFRMPGSQFTLCAGAFRITESGERPC